MSKPKEQTNTTRAQRRPRRSPGAQSQRTVRRARVASSCARQMTGDHAVRVRAVRRNPPDLDRFVAALLALALTEHPSEQDREPGRGECS
jgi:hypothetical protein